MPIPPPEASLAFFGASLLLALAPGPDNLFVLLQSALHGPRAGMLVVLGLCSGLLVHTTAVALGLAALFATSAVAFTLLKIVGASYLAYLAWKAFRSAGDAPTGAPQAAASRGSIYTRGVIMNLTNPKVAIFFLAFLPQFADPAKGDLAAQLAWLGALFILATLLVFGTIAWFSGVFGSLLQRSPGVRRALNRIAGCLFLGLAARLALDH